MGESCSALTGSQSLFAKLAGYDVRAAIRPVLLSLMGLAAASCGGAESDPQRFQHMAEQVAAIPVDHAATTGGLSSAAEGLRPALRVEVMDPHDLWDARDGLRTAVVQAAPAMIEAAAPAVAEAVVHKASLTVSEAAPALRPVAAGPSTTIQIGAYASEDGARAAWERLKDGPGRAALAGYSPTFQTVEVNGKTFTRLRVGPAPVDEAAEICRAAQVSDPWCQRRG